MRTPADAALDGHHLVLHVLGIGEDQAHLRCGPSAASRWACSASGRPACCRRGCVWPCRPGTAAAAVPARKPTRKPAASPATLRRSPSEANISTWCTTARLPGSTSATLIHLSSLKPGSTMKYWYSHGPVGGHVVRLLAHVDHRVRLARQLPAGGERARLGQLLRRRPAGAPASTHWEISFFSSSVSRRSLRNLPCLGSACQGGMRSSRTTSAIVSAQPTTSS